MIFETRYKAGEYLSTKVYNKIHNFDNTIILGILKGGLPIVYQLSQDLNIPSAFLVVKNLIVNNKKIGVTTSNGISLYNKGLIDKLGLDTMKVKEKQKEMYEEAKYDKEKYGLHYNNYSGKQVIIVDEGIYTGLTAVAASKYVKQLGASRVVLAVPVSRSVVIDRIRNYFDEIICLEMVEDRTFNLSKYYMSFYSLGTDDINELFYKMKAKDLFLG